MAPSSRYLTAVAALLLLGGTALYLRNGRTTPATDTASRIPTLHLPANPSGGNPRETAATAKDPFAPKAPKAPGESAAAIPPSVAETPPPPPLTRAEARRRIAPAPSAAKFPLVYALPPEEMPGLTPAAAAAAADIADQFYEAIGGDSPDPAAPEYRDRWKQGQSLADQRLRAAIGRQAFARWQEAAYLRQRAAAR